MRERRLSLTLLVAVTAWSAVLTPVVTRAQTSSSRSFEVRVPESWRAADRLLLVARDVSVPKNRTVVLEFFATIENAKATPLGTYGVVAESESASGSWHLEALRVNVTRPLGRYLEANPGKTTFCVRVDVVDGDRRPVADLQWSAASIEIDAPPRR